MYAITKTAEEYLADIKTLVPFVGEAAVGTEYEDSQVSRNILAILSKLPIFEGIVECSDLTVLKDARVAVPEGIDGERLMDLVLTAHDILSDAKDFVGETYEE